MPSKYSHLQPLFPAGFPVKGRELIGREEIVQDILRLLKIGQSCIITAPRRFGKTSVILEVLSRLHQEEHFTVLLDLFTIHSKRMFADRWTASCLASNPKWTDKTWTAIKKGGLTLLEGLRFKPSVSDMEIVLQFDLPNIDINTLLEKSFDFPERFAKRHDKLLFFALDEFQSILDFGDLNLVKTLRAHIQRHRQVRYLFAGSHEGLMTQLFKQKRHAFYRFGRIIELEPVSKDAFIPYIVKTFRSRNINADKSIAAAICNKTGGLPYYTQLLCQMLYEILDKLKNKTITSDHLDSAVTKLMAHEEGLFSDWWDRLSIKKHAHAILAYVTSQRSPYEIPDVSRANINRVVTDLKKLGYLAKREQRGREAHFYIRDPFFEKYIRQLVP